MDRDECADVLPEKTCQNKKDKNKCDTVKEDCKKTCDFCDDTPGPGPVTTQSPVSYHIAVSVCKIWYKMSVTMLQIQIESSLKNTLLNVLPYEQAS